MPEVSKRILTDETGQAIVTALNGLINVTDPNGTAVAAAAKINNMSATATSLSATALPTATLTESNNSFILNLGIPHELPVVDSQNNGQILKVSSGEWTVGSAPIELPVTTTANNGQILQVNNGAWTATAALPTIMTGCTTSTTGASGLVPTPNPGNEDQFLSGDGTWKSGGLPMVILSYGNSTWQEFINAYNNNVIVYCRASSQSNPKNGAQTRMAFMAYVSDADNPTSVEFQYYRSMNPTNKSITQMSDQVFVYKLSSNGTWSVEMREASIKQFLLDANEASSATYDKTTGAITLKSGLPKATTADNGKFLQVVDGAWAAVTIANANGVSF